MPETIEKSIDVFKDMIEFLDNHIELGLFCLMCVGLLLASLFLFCGLLVGSEWRDVCLGLFGSNSIATGMTHLGKRSRE